MSRNHHVRTLSRRRDYLAAQVAVLEGRGARADYARAEVAAIDYALGVLEDADAIGLPQLGRLTLAERARLWALLAGSA